MLFLVKLENPSKEVHISAEDREAAEVKLKQMRDMLEMTENTKVISFEPV